MKRKAPTNKERDQVIKSLIDKAFHHEMLLSLILEDDKELDKRITDRVIAIGRSRTENKEGT